MKTYVYSLLLVFYSCSLMGMSGKRALEDRAEPETKIVKSDMSVWNFEESEHVSCEPSVLNHFKTLFHCFDFNTDLTFNREARSAESSRIILPQGISCKQFARLSTYIHKHTKSQHFHLEDFFTDESPQKLLEIAQRADMLECAVLLRAAVTKYASQMQKSISRDVLRAYISTPIAAAGEVALLLCQEFAKSKAVFSLLQEVNQDKYPKVPKAGLNGCLCLAYHPNGHQLASGSDDHKIRIWNSDTDEVIHTLQGHTNWVRCLAYHPAGHQLASGSYDNTIRIWNSDTEEFIHTLKGHTDWVNCIVYHSDGHQLASGSFDKTIRIWNSDTGEVIHTLKGHTNWVRGLAYHPDGHQLAILSGDREMRIWNLVAGEVIHRLNGHTNWVRDLAYHPDGHQLAILSGDSTIRIWNLYDPELKKELINTASPEQLLFLLYAVQKIKDKQFIEQDLTEHYVPGLPKLIKKFIEQYKGSD